MEPRYIDAHCHIQFDQFSADQAELVARMRDERVAGVVVGCDRVSSTQAVVVATAYDHLYASVGLHPNHSDETFDSAAYRELASHAKVVAIGECGLDYFRPTEVNDEVKAKQKELFKQHIALAAELDKPLIIHTRPSKGTMDAYTDAIEILQEAKMSKKMSKGSPCSNLRGDIHFFVGGVEEANEFVALGFTLSFTAVITFARDYDEVIKTIPLTSILSETDAPYVAPLARRGQRNDPLAVIDVVNKIAEIRNEDPELVRTTLVANSERLFGI